MINWKKILLVTCDVILGGYIVVAMSAFNEPDNGKHVCTQVNIHIQDEATNGFISAPEIKARLQHSGLYPINKPLAKSTPAALRTS